MTGLAQAADMGAMPEIPVIDGGNAIEPELGTNWYLRGDIGYAATSVDVTVDLGGASTRQATMAPPGTAASASATTSDGSGRDVTLDYLAKRDATIVDLERRCASTEACPLTGPCQQHACRQRQRRTADAQRLFRPRHLEQRHALCRRRRRCRPSSSWDDWRSTSLITPETLPVIAPAINRATDDWRFAWSLMAGFSYSINQNLALDVGYRFLDITDGTALPNYRANPSSLGIGSIDYSDFYSHQVRVGFRYTID